MVPNVTEVTLLTAVTTGSGIAHCEYSQHITVEIEGSAGVSAGAIQIEVSDVSTYAGTWAPIGTPITVVASTKIVAQFAGPHKFVRTRISTTVVDGTVTVRLRAN